MSQSESEITEEDWENAKEDLDYPYYETEDSDAPMTEEDWENSKGDLDYPDKTKKKPEKEEPVDDYEYEYDDSPSWLDGIADFFKNLGPLGKVLFIILVILGLAFLIMALLGNTPWQARKKIKRGRVYSIEELDEHIHETDLERYLREAIEDNNYRGAIRVYYLMVIKTMSEKDWIKWQRDKTNYDYVREVRRKPLYHDFREITHLFEVIWYGEAPIDEKIYQMLHPSFNNFIKELDG